MMKSLVEHRIAGALALALTCACSGTSPPPDAPAPATTNPDEADATPSDEGQPTARNSLTASECEAQGGSIVGDIGDGAIHRPDYRCPNGAPPLGTIAPVDGEPVAVEGSVCCSAAP